MKRCIAVLARWRVWPNSSRARLERYPAVAQIERADEIFAIGDAHSDFNRLARVMVSAGIIESQPPSVERRKSSPRYYGRHDRQRSPCARRAAPAQHVRDQARQAGGDVVILAGNHEAEFLADPAAPKGAEFASSVEGGAYRSPRGRRMLRRDWRVPVFPLFCRAGG